MDRCGIAYTQEEVRSLVGEIERLKPFPDVVAALEKLRSKGYKLAILSNGDRDMLKAAGPHIGFLFDHVISVQEGRAISSCTGRPMRKPKRSSATTAPVFCSLPTMLSIALVPSPTACGRRSSTDVSGHLAKRRISLTLLSPISPSWPRR